MTEQSTKGKQTIVLNQSEGYLVWNPKDIHFQFDIEPRKAANPHLLTSRQPNNPKPEQELLLPDQTL